MSIEQPLVISAAQQWLASQPSGTALTACNDELAGRWLAAELGSQSPAIVGIDNNESLCTATRPRLSSVHWPVNILMKEVCNLLARQLSGEQVQADVRIPPVGVITRESTEAWVTADPLVSAALRWIQQHACQPIAIQRSRRRSEAVIVVVWNEPSKQHLTEVRGGLLSGIVSEAAKTILETSDDDLTTIAFVVWI